MADEILRRRPPGSAQNDNRPPPSPPRRTPAQARQSAPQHSPDSPERDIFSRQDEGLAVARSIATLRMAIMPEQPVGNIYVVLEVLGSRFLLQNVGDGTLRSGISWRRLVHSAKPSTSEKTVSLRFPRTANFSWLICCLPPVASQRCFGIRPAQMIAVYSDSTRATGLLGYLGSRCSPNRHCVSSQSSGSIPVRFITA